MKRRQIIWVIFLVFLSMLTMGNRVYGEKTGKPFNIELEYGISGVALYGKAMPVGVTVHNNGTDFEGRVQIYSGRTDEDKQIAYYQEVMIPENSSKKVEFVIPSLENYSTIWITIENAAGKILMQEERSVSVSNTNTGIIGVLSDDLNALNYLSGAMINDRYGYEMDVLYLKRQNIPETEGALDALSVLVIGSFDTSGLTDSQYQVIKDWVGAGGNLVLGTGAEYKKTLGIFEKDGYLTGQIGEVKKEECNFKVYDEQGEPRSAELYLLDFTVEGGRLEETLDCQIVDKGRGKVYLFPFAFEALSGWKYNREAVPYIFETILQNAGLYPSAVEMMSNDYAWNIKKIITNNGIEKIPGILPYVLILLTYIILLPVLYFMLKLRDKRHYIWFAVPIAAMLFGISIYLMGTGTRRKEPFINYTSVLQMEGEGALETEFFVVTSPRNRQYSIEIDNGYHMNVIPDYGYHSYEYKFHPKDIDVELGRKSDKTQISLRNVQAFSRTYFSAERYMEDVGTIKLDIYFSINGLSGTITNDTEFELSNCGILTEQAILPIGTLKKGESVEIDNSLLQTNISYYSFSEALIPYQYTNDSEENQKDTGKRNVIERLYDYGTNLYNSQVHFVGFADSFDPGLDEMTGLEAKGLSLVFAQSELNYKEDNAEFISDIWQYGEIREGDFYNGEVSALMSESGVAEYDFSDFDTIEAVFKGSENDYYDVHIEFLNYETGEFEIVLEDEDRLLNLEDYLNEEKKLTVKYVNDSYYSSYEEVEVPRLSVFVTKQVLE